VPTFGRCTLIGFLVGLLPGGNSAIASFMAYDIEKKMSKHPNVSDRGPSKGLAVLKGPITPSRRSMVPMLTLGVPVSAAMAILMGAPDDTTASDRARFLRNRIQLRLGSDRQHVRGNVNGWLVLNLPLVGFWSAC